MVTIGELSIELSAHTGRQFDKNGNLKQWWSDEVIERFKEAAQCIVDQYSNFTLEEVGMNVSTPYIMALPFVGYHFLARF